MKGDLIAASEDVMSQTIDERESVVSEEKERRPITTLNADIFSDVDVQLTAVLGHGILAVRALLDLTEGSIIDLDTPLDGLINLTLNNRVVAQGEIVTVNDRFGVRISKIAVDRG
jgi:flagellar motor switch protein FliN